MCVSESSSESSSVFNFGPSGMSSLHQIGTVSLQEGKKEKEKKPEIWLFSNANTEHGGYKANRANNDKKK